MTHDRYSDAHIRAILDEVKTVAMVGASPNAARPSYLVLKYMLAKGYRVFPINPGHAGKEILGQRVHAALHEVPEPIDMVDIFRNSAAALSVTREALTLDPLPKVIWMQLTVRNDEAAQLAEEKGLRVIMNRCPKIEYGRLSGEIGWTGVNSRTLSSKRPALKAGFQHRGLRKE
ncbi:CoA-binding protein [Stappia sp.]|uniref:CoA-binding protein n=1 Tax=Stappia sp. TaxID=1870903 RepID=UPI0032D9199E